MVLDSFITKDLFDNISSFLYKGAKGCEIYLNNDGLSADNNSEEIYYIWIDWDIIKEKDFKNAIISIFAISGTNEISLRIDSEAVSPFIHRNDIMVIESMTPKDISERYNRPNAVKINELFIEFLKKIFKGNKNIIVRDNLSVSDYAYTCSPTDSLVSTNMHMNRQKLYLRIKEHIKLYGADSFEFIWDINEDTIVIESKHGSIIKELIDSICNDDRLTLDDI